MQATGIRELKDNLSHYVGRSAAGERIAITSHGRVIAHLVPPGNAPDGPHPRGYQALVAAGAVRSAASNRFSGRWPDIRLKGSVAELIAEDRGEI